MTINSTSLLSICFYSTVMNTTMTMMINVQTVLQTDILSVTGNYGAIIVD